MEILNIKGVEKLTLKRTILTTIIAIMALALVTSTAFAGHYNQNTDENGKSVELGTGKSNPEVPSGVHIDGCRPPEESGSVWVQILPAFLGPWEGGLCCASNTVVGETSGGVPIYAPNQCCNPPQREGYDLVPGNHCECFGIRGYP
jgi:hypothetical protein